MRAFAAIALCFMIGDGTGTIDGLGSESSSTKINFTLGEMEDGCFPIEVRIPGEEEEQGSICGHVYTYEASTGTLVFHKRR